MAGASAAAVYEEGLTEAIHDDEAISEDEDEELEEGEGGGRSAGDLIHHYTSLRIAGTTRKSYFYQNRTLVKWLAAEYPAIVEQSGENWEEWIIHFDQLTLRVFSEFIVSVRKRDGTQPSHGALAV